MQEITFTILGSILTSDWTEIVTGDGTPPMIFTEITGPEDAFEVKEHRGRDFVRIVKDYAVTTNTYRCAT